MNSLDEFFSLSTQPIQWFADWCTKMNPKANADHICYKCSSSKEFEQIRRLFETESDFIYQSIISDRRIAIMKMKRSLVTPLGEISLLELSDQKPDNSQTSGFDHVEIYPLSGSMDELAATLASIGTSFEKTVRPHHTTYDMKIHDEFKVRLEDEPLLKKIMREEM